MPHKKQTQAQRDHADLESMERRPTTRRQRAARRMMEGGKMRGSNPVKSVIKSTPIGAAASLAGRVFGGRKRKRRSRERARARGAANQAPRKQRRSSRRRRR